NAGAAANARAAANRTNLDGCLIDCMVVSSRERAMMSHAGRAGKPASPPAHPVLPGLTLLRQRNPFAQDPHLVRGGRTPEAVLAPPFDHGGAVAHRGDELPLLVEDVGAPAVADHDEGLAAGVHQEIRGGGAGEVGERHAGGAVAVAMALLGVLGAPLLAPEPLLQTAAERLEETVDARLDRLVRRARRLGKLVLDTAEDGLRPAHRVAPGDLAEAVPEVVERLAGRAGADDVEAETAAVPALLGARRDHLEGDRHRRQQPAMPGWTGRGEIGRQIPAHRHLTVQAVSPRAATAAAAQVGEQVGGELDPRAHDGGELRRVAVEQVDARIAPLQQPLAEVLEAGSAGAAVAGEHLPPGGRHGVLAFGALAAEAEDPPRLEDGGVLDQLLESGLESILGIAAHLLDPPLAQSGGHRHVEIEGLAAAGQQMPLRMEVDTLPRLVGEKLHRLADPVAGRGGHAGRALLGSHL